jgi:hypothetical protein
MAGRAIIARPDSFMILSVMVIIGGIYDDIEV